jgi:hypothetical protein
MSDSAYVHGYSDREKYGWGNFRKYPARALGDLVYLLVAWLTGLLRVRSEPS